MASNVYAFRRENLRKLIDQWHGPGALGAKLGYSNASFLVQMAGPNPTREVSERTARKVERALDLPVGWLDSEPEKEKAPVVDTVKVSEVIRLVGQAVEEANVKLSASKFADVVSLAYADAQSAGGVRPDFIRQLIALTK